MTYDEAWEGAHVIDTGGYSEEVLEILRLYTDTDGVECAEVAEIFSDVNEKGEYIETFNISLEALEQV